MPPLPRLGPAALVIRPCTLSPGGLFKGESPLLLWCPSSIFCSILAQALGLNAPERSVPRCDGHAPRAHRISRSRLMKTCLALGPRQVLPQVAARRALAAPLEPGDESSLQGRPADDPTASSKSMSRHRSQAPTWARLHLIWCSNGVITRTDSTAEEDAFLPSALSADGGSRASWHSHWSVKTCGPTRSSYGVFPSSPGRKLIDRGR